MAEGHSHGRPVDIKEFFRPEDLASLTEQIVLSSESSGGDAADAQRVQLEVERLHDPGLPGELVQGGGTPLDAQLSMAQQQALHGGLTHKKRQSPRGRIDVSRTMPRNLRYDGVPFRPVTTRLAEDKPRLVVVADVSLSVRTTARFTPQVVHALQVVHAQVHLRLRRRRRGDHDLFDEHALGLVFGGDVIDVDASSDYGTAFAALAADHSGAFTHRSTLMVLGDGGGNGNAPRRAAPRLDVFAELTRRVRETIWLTPSRGTPRRWVVATCRPTRSTAAGSR